jgi:plasmid stabilization system protein ParE
MSQIVWTQAAIADLNRHYDFIKLNDVDAATRAVQAIVSSAESLQQNPRWGTMVDIEVKVDSSFSKKQTISLYLVFIRRFLYAFDFILKSNHSLISEGNPTTLVVLPRNKLAVTSALNAAIVSMFDTFVVDGYK